MRWRNRVAILVLIILAVSLVFTGFSGSSQKTLAQTSPLPSDSSTPHSGNRLLELLHMMPGTAAAESHYLTLNDYAQLRRTYQIAVPEPAGDEQLDDYYQAITRTNGRAVAGYGAFISGFGSYFKISPVRQKNLGYNALNVDADIQAGSPPNILVGVKGRFSPSTTAAIFKRHAGWSAETQTGFSVENYRNINIYSWGSGLTLNPELRLAPPDYDELGRAKPLAMTEQQLFYAAATLDIQAMIDASEGNSASLAEVPEFVAVALALSEFNVYSGILGDAKAVEKTSFKPETSQAPPLRPFSAFGTAVGKDENGAYMALAIYHDNPASALENADILKQRIENLTWSGGSWKQWVKSVTVTVNGNLLSAKLYGDNIELFGLRWFYERSPLLSHE